MEVLIAILVIAVIFAIAFGVPMLIESGASAIGRFFSDLFYDPDADDETDTP